MNKIFTKENKNRLKIKLRKKLNPYLAPFRRQLEGVNSPLQLYLITAGADWYISTMALVMILLLLACIFLQRIMSSLSVI